MMKRELKIPSIETYNDLEMFVTALKYVENFVAMQGQVRIVGIEVMVERLREFNDKLKCAYGENYLLQCPTWAPPAYESLLPSSTQGVV